MPGRDLEHPNFSIGCKAEAEPFFSRFMPELPAGKGLPGTETGIRILVELLASEAGSLGKAVPK